METSSIAPRRPAGGKATARAVLLGACALLVAGAAVCAETCNCAGNGSEPGKLNPATISASTQVQCNTGGAPAAKLTVGFPTVNGSAALNESNTANTVCATSVIVQQAYDNPPVPTTTCFKAVPYSVVYSEIYTAAGCIAHPHTLNPFEPTTYTCAPWGAGAPLNKQVDGQIFLAEPCGWSS
ncbi:MAG: hypothetical protein ACP5O1_11485 [Phycisphaerae bacterium]